jgi:hypothetical protein
MPRKVNFTGWTVADAGRFEIARPDLARREAT